MCSVHYTVGAMGASVVSALTCLLCLALLSLTLCPCVILLFTN